MSELPLNSNLTFPKALKYISSSLSKSNVPEVSTEYAWTFEYGSDVYELLDVEGNPKWIDCNKVRIYHPANTKAINGILYVDNYIILAVISML